MSATYYLILTEYGAQRIAQLQADQSSALLLVNFVAGDANGQPYLPQTRIAATALINQRVSVPLQSVDVVDNDRCQAVAVLDATVGGFNIHEIGITDSTGQLVYIGNYHGGYKPVLSEGAGGDLTLALDLVANGIGTVVISLEPSFAYASKEWVDTNFVHIPTFNNHVSQNALEHSNLANMIGAEGQVRFDEDQYQRQRLNGHIDQNALEHSNILILIQELFSIIAALREDLSMTQLAALIQFINLHLIPDANKRRAKIGQIETVGVPMTAEQFAARQGDGSAWAIWGEGRVVVGSGTNVDIRGEQRTFNNGDFWGEYSHVQTHDEMHPHTHSSGHPYNKFAALASDAVAVGQVVDQQGDGITPTTDGADGDFRESELQVADLSAAQLLLMTERQRGNGQPFNIMQPYIVANRFICIQEAPAIPPFVLPN